MAPPVLRPLTLGEILDVSFGVYRARFAALVVVAAVVQIIPLAFNILNEGLGSSPLMTLVIYVIALVLSAVGIAATTRIVSSTYLGQPMGAGEALREATPLIGTLMIISLLTGLLIVFGLVLLIVPGLILMAGLILASAVAVIESPIKATDAMRRSWQLTSGFRTRTFMAVLIPMILLIVPMTIVGVILGILGLVSGVDNKMLASVLTAIVSVFFYPFIYVSICVNYYDLRVRKEGFDLELMAAGGVTSALGEEMPLG